MGHLPGEGALCTSRLEVRLDSRLSVSSRPGRHHGPAAAARPAARPRRRCDAPCCPPPPRQQPSHEPAQGMVPPICICWSTRRGLRELGRRQLPPAPVGPSRLSFLQVEQRNTVTSHSRAGKVRVGQCELTWWCHAPPRRHSRPHVLYQAPARSPTLPPRKPGPTAAPPLPQLSPSTSPQVGQLSTLLAASPAAPSSSDRGASGRQHQGGTVLQRLAPDARLRGLDRGAPRVTCSRCFMSKASKAASGASRCSRWPP